MSTPARHPVPYRERLRAPLWTWALGALLVASVAAVFLVVLSPAAVLGVVVVVGALVSWGLVRSGATVGVVDGELLAGHAHVPLDVLGPVTALDAAAAARLRGRDIDPGAHHLIRAWVPTAIRVELADPQDPTPYWYVSTARPDALVAAIERARGG